MKRAALLTLLLTVLATTLVLSYSRPRFQVGADVLQSRWPVTSPVQVTVNIAGPNFISPGSQPFEAVRNAFESRSAYSAITFALVLASSPDTIALDGTSLVTFKDTPTNRSVSAGFGAVTFFWFNIIGGEIIVTESDIVFNPLASHTTTGAAGLDIENLGSHEIDHFLSLEHSAVIASTGYPNFLSGDTTKRSLDADDISGTEFLYPFPDFETRTGSLSGNVSFAVGGAPVFGAQVVAVRQDGEPVSELSVGGGDWVIDGLVPGDYTIYAEPFDGPYFENLIDDGIYSTPFDTVFGTFIAGGAATPMVYSLPAGGSIGGINFSVSSQVRVNPTAFGLSPNGTTPVTQSVAVSVPQGGSAFLSVSGFGVDQIPDDGLLISGTGVNVSSAGVVRGTVGGNPFMIASLTVDANAPAVSRSIIVQSTLRFGTITGGFQVLRANPLPDLLRTDVVTSTAPLIPPLAGIFPLDGLGPDGFPGIGEGVLRALPGSDDDDDLYVPQIPSGFLDPDIDVLTDTSRPVVFYRLSDPTATLLLDITPSGRLRFVY